MKRYTTILEIHFPVWRELKRIRPVKGTNRKHSWDTLSRLKGIETDSNLFCRLSEIHLRYTFPFEGNWNLWTVNSPYWLTFGLRYTFPFEGNWNGVSNHCCKSHFGLRYTFPFEGNWNLLVLNIQKGFCAWDTLSRLKGIETAPTGPIDARFLCLRYTFPFEGNWNAYASWLVLYQSPLEIHFPVWRELKRALWGC